MRFALLKYLQAAMPQGTAFDKLEPSSSSYISTNLLHALRP